MANEGSAERHRAFSSDREILDIIERFRARTLPKERWTHQAHLIVGLWFVMTRPPELVLGELRRGISSYNEAVGTANTDSDGYHETITAFYVWAIRKFVSEAAPGTSLLILANDLLASRYAAGSFPFEYYSRSRLLSVAARRGWMDPDLAPLD